MRALAALLAALLSLPAVAQTLLDFSPGERERIVAHGPWPPPAVLDPSNRVDGRRAAIEFGALLFFDPRLSADGRFSCASCHLPPRAFQDGLPVAASRAGATRNTPTLLDSAHRRWFGWDGAQDSLWAASVSPLLKADEMGQTPASLAATVRREPHFAAAYRRAFGAAPGTDDEKVAVDVAKALAAWQATWVSPRTPFDDFRDALARGDDAAAARYPPAAQRGLRLFIGEARCSVCHAGAAFSNGEFADIGMPFFVPGGVDSGRHGGLQKLLASRMNRLGPHNDAGVADVRAVATRHVIVEPRHFGEFKVPGLRQLAHTAPYMHDGSLARLEDVVQHYSALNEERLHADGERILRRLDLTPQQAADLVAFLRSLSR
jgi:cytochrome c peroxidase